MSKIAFCEAAEMVLQRDGRVAGWHDRFAPSGERGRTDASASSCGQERK